MCSMIWTSLRKEPSIISDVKEKVYTKSIFQKKIKKYNYTFKSEETIIRVLFKGEDGAYVCGLLSKGYRQLDPPAKQ